MTITLLQRTFCATIFSFIALTGGALAGQPEPVASEPPEIGRITTSDRQSEPLEAAARTTYVVTKVEMLRRGLTTVADALRIIPGISIQRYGSVGSLADIRIRGSSSAQVLVLLDGRPIGGAQTGTVDLGAVSTSGVERIEVVEGGGATLYGTGAIGGVVNIITGRLRGAPIVTLRDGSFGDRLLNLETRNVSFERRIARNDYDYPGGVRANADLASTTAHVNFDRNFGNVRLETTAGIADHHLGVPGPLGFVSLTSRQNSVDGDAQVRLEFERAGSTTTLEFSGTRQQLSFFSDPSDPNGCGCFTVSREGRLQASFRNVVRSGRSRAVYGIDLARGVARVDAGDGSDPPVRAFAQSAAYVQENLALGPGSSVYAGLRAERDGSLGGAFAPSLGGIARLSPSLSLKANYAAGFRAPSAVDLFFPGFSNPNLVPEKTTGGDVTLTTSALLGGASFGWFTLAGNNLITVDPTFTTVINVQRASISGLTLDLQTLPFHHLVARFNATNLYRALDLTAAPRRLPRRPVITANLDLRYVPDPGGPIESAGIVSHNVGQRDPAAVAAAYTRTDAYVRTRVALRGLLTLRLENVGNERYSEVPGFPSPGRTFALELSTR